MYKTKKEVDAHVRIALSKLRSETERHLRSFTIAKLYYKINEYSAAEQYLCSYLSVKDDNDQAHKLLGQCYQRLKKPDKALQSFQRSLQLNDKQPDVLVEVCQLLLEDKNLNANKAKYWCDLAESAKVQHDAVFSLRLKLMNKDSLETNQVEELIQKEISARPNDVQLRVRLVRNYIEQNKLLDAFKYVYALELSHQDAFGSSSEWYNIVWLVLSKYEQMPNTKKDWEFYLLLTSCLERQVYISFSLTSGTAAGGGVTETANLLFNLDQYLYKISQLADKLSAQRELIDLFLEHYRGQLLLHSAALIFKRELLQNKNKWKESVRAVLPLLLLAFQIEAPDNNKEPWMKHCDEQGKHLIQLWNREGAFRCAQVGRTLLSCVVDVNSTDKENATYQINNMLGSGSHASLWNNCDDLLAQIRQTCSDKQWRRNIFAILFCNSDQKVKEQTSLLIKSAQLAEPIFELPTYATVERFEETAQYLQPQSLQHMVYLCLGNDNLAYVRAKYFSGLNFSTQNLSFCGAESLNQLDVETFLYAASLQAKRMLEVDRDAFDNYNSGNRSAAGKPRILPFVNLKGQLCSEEQSNWWTAAYQVYKNLTADNLSELRQNLQFGIEAVRGINGPKIDMIIVFKLGQIFVARAQDIVRPVEKAFLEARADSIYKYGLNMLKMDKKGVLEPFRKYFKYAKANTSIVEREVNTAAEDAVSYLAARYFKKAEYEELIDELAGIQLPFATYLQAEAYRKMDEANKTPKKTKRLYLDRASECLNQTLSLLKSTATDPNHPLNSVIHAELKRLQQASSCFVNENSGSAHTNYSPVGHHNNSSTYEDAEDDFVSMSINRTARREAAAAAAALIASPRNSELENLVKQMANTLTFVKEEIVDTIKPEVISMRKEITSLKDKIAHLEDAMKKTSIRNSNPPSRDDASNMLDDYYILEDALQNQLFQPTPTMPTQSHMPNANMFSNGPAVGGVHSPFASQQQQQQQRIHTPNALQNAAAAAAAAAAYNSPMFNPNYPMNYYTPPPYMMTPQNAAAAAGASAMLGQRNPLALPFMDAGSMNFNMQQNAPLLPPPSQDARTSNLYGLLTQPQQPPQQPNMTPQLAQLPQLPVPMSMPQIVAPPSTITNIATGMPIVAQAPAPLQPIAQFNKTLNNQPVEKGPPANVVITNSDPLPNPNSVLLQTQQPTLSVTIPSHHIKQSLVQTPDAVVPPTSQPNIVAPFSGFGLSTSSAGGSPFGGFSNSSVTTTPASSGTSIFGSSSTTGKGFSASTTSASITSVQPITAPFSFKPAVAQAAAQSAAQSAIETLNKTNDSFASDVANKSAGDIEAEYDPRPDFKPIIPLPDEIEVKTGEEDEDVMFCYRAKLFRNVEKEWKERGIGDIKILKSKDGSSRILMRRDQTHKICANHKITSEIMMTTPQTETKGHIWVANDFADEKLQREKFFVRFKLPETAQQFLAAFQQAQKEAASLEKQKNAMPAPAATVAKAPADNKSQKSVPPFGLAKSGVANFATSTPAAKSDNAGGGGLLAKPSIPPTIVPSAANAASKTLFSGFTLPTSTSTVTPVTPAVTKTAAPEPIKPFANFTFDKIATVSSTVPPTVPSSNTSSPFANMFSNLGKSAPSPFSTANLPSFQATTTPITPTASPAVADASAAALNKSDAEDEYVPTAQFNPVIPLPDLVEVSTGEENEIVLFEYRAKLLRFDKDVSEWKERGLGIMKLLQDKNDANKVRLVMRREQIHKLCCNQRLYKGTSFKYVKNSQTALSWAGQDYSENELVTEMFTIRFKSPETCKQFHAAVLNAQANMSSAAEEDNVKQQESADKQKAAAANNVASKEASTKGFGDAFKPKAGSWCCDACYITNPGDNLYCVACDTPKDDTVPKKEEVSNPLLTTTTNSTFSFGFPAPVVTANTTAAAPATNAKPAFTFGMPATPATTTTSTAAVTKPSGSGAVGGFGAQFKPKAGSWDCEACYLSNKADAIYCQACDAPKDNTIPKKETAANSDVLALSNPTQKFSFGFPAVTAAAAAPAETMIKSAPTSTTLFGSLANAAASGDASKSFTFTPPSATSTTLNAASLTKPNFSFSLQSKAMDTPTTLSGTEPTTSPFSLDKKDFSFTLKPKSPGKVGKSPLKHGGGGDADVADADADDADYEEEENNTYFTPVIALPDKIDVKTGEEDEELLYVHRAKLYRFIEGEWKERGVGDLKILRHKDTKKLRVVMRRDQILKICLNHVLNNDVEYKRKDDKSWLFVVNDFSEGEVELEKFSLRFKSKEIAQGFMDSVTNALAGTAKVVEGSGSLPNAPTNSTTTPVTTAPITISNVDRQTADKLKLPYEFFTAKPTCTGCRGCDPDKFVYSTVNNPKEVFVNEDDTRSPLGPLQMPALSLPKATASGTVGGVLGNRSFLKQSALSPAPPVAANATCATNANESIFSGFGGANSTAFSSATATSVSDKPANITFSFTAALNSTSKPDDTKPTSGGFLFGNNATATEKSGGSLFGGDGKSAASCFSSNKEVFGQAPSIFGNANIKDNSNIAATTEKPTSIFGGSYSTTSTTGGSIFGGKAVFGGSPSIFGVSSAETKNDSTPPTSIFGSSSNNSTQSAGNGTGNSIFGNSSTAFTGFSSNNTAMQTSIFGGSNNSLFIKKEQDATAAAASPTFADLSSKPGAIDFASLAAKAPIKSSAETSNPGGFIGLTNQDAFSSFAKTSNNNNSLNTTSKLNNTNNANESYRSVDDGGDDGGGVNNEENYDPHYEPIIALPSEIVVSTGEEDETKLFGERATLYRWDATNKEWKERGVGELKILLHPANQTYRLVMRREQIYKLVLNHAISSEFIFNPMNNNPKSLVWAAMNYAESTDGELEKLAVRFKKVELAEKFSKQLEECIEALQNRADHTQD